MVWIANEYIGEDYDPMEPDFWADARVEKAVAIATEAIAENGYKVIRLSNNFRAVETNPPTTSGSTMTQRKMVFVSCSSKTNQNRCQVGWQIPSDLVIVSSSITQD